MTQTATAAIVGTWTASATLDGEKMPHQTTFVFHPDHTLEAIGPDGPDGKPFFTGTGHWISRPDGTFLYHMTHPVPSPDGGPDLGTVYNIQQVTVSGSAYTSNGSGIMHNADGTVNKPASVSLTATRT